tara:strand:+ start:5560 stop:6447 length:888 start_codon:yes stop_codon:yes gene_type:complete
MTIEREQLIEEMKLRKIIRKGINVIKERKADESYAQQINEWKLRKLVRKMLISEKMSPSGNHRSTGIAKLSKFLHNIIDTLEDDYKELKTGPEQRESFRVHVLHNVEKTLAPEKLNAEAGEKDFELKEDLEEEKLNLSIDTSEDENALDTPEDDPMFLDLPRKSVKDNEEEKVSKEDQEMEDFGKGLEDRGLDQTGRVNAKETFDNLFKNQMVTAYNNLANEADKNIFYDYLIANLKLYFDKFESEMQNDIQEPESEVYQQQKTGGEPVPSPAPTPLEESIKFKLDIESLKNLIK